MWFLMRDIVTQNHFWRLRCEKRMQSRHKHICDKIQLHTLADLVDWKSIYGTIIANNRDISERDTLFCMDCGILAPSEHNKNGLTLLKHACTLGYNQVVSRCLLDSNIDPTVGQLSCLDIACWNGQAETVKLLLADTRMDPRRKNSRSFILAATRGHSEAVAVLMRDGRCDINIQQGWVAKDDKIVLPEDEYLKLAHLLLSDPRFNPAMHNSWYLISACILGHASVVELLLKDGRADPSAVNHMAVNEARIRGDKHILDMLVADHRVDAEIRRLHTTASMLSSISKIVLATAIGLTALYAVHYIDREYYGRG
ncbi:Hypothetical protein POVR2_LOCUS396 [uncultured virus]|nr:Hypothetical protein POVR2_LOCUS396 [uncultured virus]